MNQLDHLRRNSVGYGGFGMGISDSFSIKDEVSAKTGQLQWKQWRRSEDRLGSAILLLFIEQDRAVEPIDHMVAKCFSASTGSTASTT
jgi:hypothetical protein